MFFLLLFSKNCFESLTSWAFRPKTLFEAWHFVLSCFWGDRKKNTTCLRMKTYKLCNLLSILNIFYQGNIFSLLCLIPQGMFSFSFPKTVLKASCLEHSDERSSLKPGIFSIHVFYSELNFILWVMMWDEDIGLVTISKIQQVISISKFETSSKLTLEAAWLICQI